MQILDQFFQFLISWFWFILPTYFANSSPVFIYGILKKRNYCFHRIDKGKHFLDGKPILGKGKTVEGSIFGIFCGSFIGFLQVKLQKIINIKLMFPISLKFAFVMSVGAIFGDIIESFFKRRLNIKRGENFPIFDSIDFILGAFFFIYLFLGFWNLYLFVFSLIFTPVIHRAFNILAYILGLKDVPW